MSNSKHTPGPWAISERAKGFAIGGARNTVCSIGFLDEQAKADANLIAAAPELLELLVEAANLIRNGFGPIHPGSSAGGFLVDADAIIAKATGSGS